MMKVTLRAYNREIETLIDQGHTEEAIAHCLHILKTFPKHLETYRLMGKAYLEAHRYTEAADIFMRVLLAVPDDFVSQLGMSIVSDERRDLGGAIWHMERAFEINSTNSGIQGELRRLYGRRDGVEPTRIHLTRGALAHIYTKAGEYQQAIGEIKAVLADDNTRNDMKTLLARAYFGAGMKNDALETCSELLKIYPYSLDANRILVGILTGTSMAQGVEQYKRRINSLDPYAAAATSSLFDTLTVPDNAVQVDHLEWEPGQTPQKVTSAPAPSTPAPATGEIPTWMKQSGWAPSTGEPAPETAQPETPAEAAPAGEQLAAAEIPDWLKAMAPAAAIDNSSAEPVSNGKTDKQDDAADFDWLASLGAPLTPSETQTGTTPASPTPAFLAPSSDKTPAAESNLDWMKEVAPSPVSPAPAAGTGLDWLNNMSANQDFKPAAEQDAGELPDWLKDLANEPANARPATPNLSDTMPNWLKDLARAEQSQTPTGQPTSTTQPALSIENIPATPPAVIQPTPQPAAAETPFPALASKPEASDSGQEDALAWLESLAQDQEAKPEAQTASVPAWFTEQPAAETPAAPTPVIEQPAAEEPASEAPLSALVSGPGTSASDQDDALAWLESLAQNQGARPEELITKPEDRTATVPAWFTEQPAAETPAAPTPVIEQPAAEEPAAEAPLSALVSGPGTSPSDQDDALAWLESLAQNQGAKPEELITKPEDRTATAPAWFTEQPAAETPIIEQPAAEEPATEAPLSALVSGPGTSASDQDDALAWLESLAQNQGAKPEELITKPEDRTATVPAWFTEQPVVEATAAPEPTPAAEEPAAEAPLSALVSGPGTSASDQDDALAWLESLAQNQGAKPEELITKPEDRTATVPAWFTEQPAAETPIIEQPAAEEPAAEAPLSALVSGPGTSASDQDDALAWLESLAQNQGAKPEELITKPEDRTATVPAWFTEQPAVEATAAPEPTPAAEEPAAEAPLSALVSGPGTSASDQDDALAWLESLAQNQGAKPEELITKPEDRTATVPAWFTEQPAAEATAAPTPVAEQPAPEEPAAEAPLSALVSGPGTSASDQDDALAWLESLAQNQGAKPEELITKPEDRTATVPAWFTEQPAAEATAAPTPVIEQPTAEEPAAEAPLSALVSGPGTSASDQDDAMAWLESLAQNQGAKPEELITKPENRTVSAPAWVTEQPAAETPAAPTLAPQTPAFEQDEDLAWFESLSQKSGAIQEQPSTVPGSQGESLPDWLTEQLAAEAPAAQTPAPQAPAANEDDDLAWMKSLGTGTPSAESKVKAFEQDDSLSWLTSIDQDQTSGAGELNNQPFEGSEELPAWMSEQRGAETPAVQTPPAEEPAAQPAAEIPVAAQPDEEPSKQVLTQLAKTQPIRRAQITQPAEPLLAAAAAAMEALPEPDLSQLGRASAGYADEIAAQQEAAQLDITNQAQEPAAAQPVEQTAAPSFMETPPTQPETPSQAATEPVGETPSVEDEFDWLGDLSLPMEPSAPETAPLSAAPPANARTLASALPDAPEVSLDWLTGPNRPGLMKAAQPETPAAAEAPASETAAQPAQESPAEAFDWMGNLGQAEASSAHIAMPWEQETPPAAEETVPATNEPEESAAVTGFTATGPELATLPWETETVDLNAAPAAETGSTPDETPDWLAGLQTEAAQTDQPLPWEQAPAQTQDTEPAASAAPEELDTPPAGTEEDDTDTWLTSLGQSAPKSPEALSWDQFTEQPEDSQPIASATPEETESGSSGQDDTDAWLASLDNQSPKSIKPQAWKPVSDEMEISQPAEGAISEEPEAAPGSGLTDDTAAWLASLDETAPTTIESFPWKPASAVDENLAEENQAEPTGPETRDLMPWEQETAADVASNEPQPRSDISEWLKHLEEADQQPSQPAESAPWLNPISAPLQAQESELDELPDWLKDTTPEEHLPAAQPEAVQEPVFQQPEEPAVPAPVQPVSIPEPQPAAVRKPVEIPAVPQHPAAPDASKDIQTIQKARQLLGQSNLNNSMNEYSRLIKRGKQLEDVIKDLQAAVYTHPVDVIVWQTLGDAFFRSNRLQEALDAYSKAEGLLR